MTKKSEWPWSKSPDGDWMLFGGQFFGNVSWRWDTSARKKRWSYADNTYRSLAAAKRAAEDDARKWLTAALRALPKRKAGAR